MAEIDTGLGWAAKDTWLLSSSGPTANVGRMTTIGGPDYPGQPLAQVASNSDINLGTGFCIYETSETDHTYIANTKGSLGTADNAEVVCAMVSDGTTAHLLVISPTQYSYIGYAAYNPVSDTWRPGGTTILNAQDSTTGLYYRAPYSGYDLSKIPSNVPIFQSNRAAFDAVQRINIVFSKKNPGFAVACVVKWRTQNNTLLQSPILISSERDNIDFEISGTAEEYYDQVSSHLYNGMRFYMKLYINLPYPVSSSGNVPFYDISASETPNATIDQLFARIAQLDNAAIVVLSAPDPYQNEGEVSAEDGGDGTDPDDDPVDEETLPIPAVVGLGFSTIYVPTQSDLYNLAAYLWGGNLDLDNFLKLFANPMDSILGLSAVPLVLSGTYEPIYLGGQQLQGITMPRYTGRTAVKVDMGTVTIKERWGAYLDYDPYTELAVYVPFVGIKNIKADDVMGKTVQLMYDIDILSGACIAYIRPEGGSPLYEWSGQCAMQIPITGANWDNIFSTAINTVATLGGALFAPASAPVLGGAVASAASQAIAAKPRIERSGAVNGITGFLGQLRPYIIRTIPEAYIPNDQNKFIGYPSYVSVNLGSLIGYNEIASIHLENIPATGDELAELESILKGGAIF